MDYGKCYPRVLIIILLMAGVLITWSCTPVARKSVPPQPASDEPYDFTSEGKIPPLAEEAIDKEADIEEMAVRDDNIDVEEVAPQIDSSFVVVEQPPKQPVMREGYRVQVFAAENSISAEKVKQEVEREFSLPVYVTPLDGMYKVRIGDFATRGEAETFLPRCKAAGYKDAWIVQTPVRVPAGDQ